MTRPMLRTSIAVALLLSACSSDPVEFISPDAGPDYTPSGVLQLAEYGVGCNVDNNRTLIEIYTALDGTYDARACSYTGDVPCTPQPVSGSETTVQCDSDGCNVLVRFQGVLSLRVGGSGVLGTKILNSITRCGVTGTHEPWTD